VAAQLGLIGGQPYRGAMPRAHTAASASPATPPQHA
jgi:hypothetical protein